MTPLRSALFALLVSAAATPDLTADGKPKLSEHAFFKHLIGEWKAEGELKSTSDGNTIKIKQEWAGKTSDEGELIIEGTRIVNDGEVQKYRWTITHNPTTDLFEAVQLNPDDAANAIRFEGTVTGTPPALELRAQFGNGGGSLTITDTFTGEGHDLLETKVVALNDAGGINLEGVIKNKRVK